MAVIDIRTGKPLTTTRRKVLGGLAGILATGAAPAAIIRSALGARTAAWSGQAKWKNPYVTDGLFAQFDAICNGGEGKHSDSCLVELVSGKAVAASGNNISYGKDYILIGGSSGYTGQEADISLYDNIMGNVTLEMVFTLYEWVDNASMSYFLFLNSWSKRLICVYAESSNTGENGFQIRATSYNTAGAVSMAFKFSSSDIGKTFRLVGRVDSSSVQKIWYRNGFAFITASNTRGSVTDTPPSTYTFFNTGANIGVKLHAIRMYKKYLTDEELEANYNVDKARFSLP